MTQAPAEPLTWRLWLWRVVLACCLLVATLGSIEFLVTEASGRLAAMGVTWDTSTVGVRWDRVASLRRGGPAEEAGLRVGDDVRFDRLLALDFLHSPGEQLPTTVQRNGIRFRLILTARANTGFVEPVFIAMDRAKAVISLFVFAFCTLLLVRGGRRRTPLLLASILFAMHIAFLPTLWVPVPFATGWLFARELLSAPFLLAAVPAFCIEVSGGMPGGPAGRVFRVGMVAFCVAGFALASSGVIVASFWNGPVPPFVVVTGSTALGIWGMIRNYPRGDAATRNRIWIVALAFLCFAARQVLSNAFNALLAQGHRPSDVAPVIIGAYVFEFAAVLLLVYAVLKQRLFDLSFAINRTLVYGAVSFTLLAAFGLAEWGADRLVPESWHRQSALYSAGIALLLFLSFHRVRDWFERQVERLFFAGWQRAQADLKRFVASAGHFRQAPALCREFAAEVERFALGAEAALYLREDGGGFARQCGALDSAARYTEEERAFALLAAERAPVDLVDAHSALPGAMAFPMLDQLGLAGFVLLGARPDGGHYRPDEIDNLAWATQQVGLDLQALQARELRDEVTALRDKLARAERKRRPPKLTAVPAA